MQIVLVVLGLILLSIAIFVAYRIFVFRKSRRKMAEKAYTRVQVLHEKLESGHLLLKEAVVPFASNILTREATWNLLFNYNQSSLFPDEFNTIEKAAESNLANWLEFPTELNACPDEMELVQKVVLDDYPLYKYYYVFRFRTEAPHWAAKLGWMLGVVGPYSDGSKPY